VETDILLWIHQHASPALDGIFRFSNELGTGYFCIPLVAGVILWHLVRREHREVVGWLLVGLATLLLPEVIKLLVARSRPELWPRIIEVSGFSFPSGHAVAGAALYPLLSWVALRSRPRLRRWSWALGLIPAAYVGLGRLYLGVHWPTDVVAGWLLGAALSGTAVWWINRERGTAVLAAAPPSGAA
jgi:undecaprenyl-diphosphatase